MREFAVQIKLAGCPDAGQGLLGMKGLKLDFFFKLIGRRRPDEGHELVEILGNDLQFPFPRFHVGL